VGLATALTASRLWCHPRDDGFVDDIQNARAVGSWRLPLRLQRAGWKPRPCVAGSGFLMAAWEGDTWSCRVKPKLQWRLQEGY
jgi:hypothetical protein